jgi:hypothetical protein
MMGGDETIQTLRELQKFGFTDDDFRRIHHMSGSMEQHIKYCAGKKFQEGSANELVLRKLRLELMRRKDK